MENNKIRELKELIQKEYIELFHNKGEYNQLLKTMGYVNFNNFENVMAVFVQKPGARFVATFDGWNTIDRYVKRGSKGALTFADKLQTKVKYYFALEDTHGLYHKKFDEWTVETDKLFYILSKEFDVNNSENIIYDSVRNFLSRNKDIIVNQLNIHNYEYTDLVEEFIINSVTEAVSYRFGYEVSYDYTKHLESLDSSSLGVIGTIIAQSNNTIINIIKKLDIEISKDFIYNHNATIINNGSEIERSVEYGAADRDRLCSNRGLSISGDDHRLRGADDNEIWDDAQRLHDGEQSEIGGEAGQRVETDVPLGSSREGSRGTAQEDSGEESERSDSNRGDNRGASQRTTSSVGIDNGKTRAGDNISGSEGVRTDGYTSDSGEGSDQVTEVSAGGITTQVNNDSIMEKADVESSAFFVDVRFSEHHKIEAKRYELLEFNALVKEISHEWAVGKKKTIEKYGSIDNAMDNGDYTYVEYAKTSIKIDVPGMEEIATRIDIGDFDEDLLGYLSHYPEYDKQVKFLNKHISTIEQSGYEYETDVVPGDNESDSDTLEADEVISEEAVQSETNLIYEQMSLFDLAPSQAEQIGDIIAANAYKPQNNISSDIFISDQLVRDIIASGANYEARNAMYYRITRPFDTREKMVEFVKRQYEGSMKGIILENGDKIAIYADEMGLKIAHGTRARVKWERLVPYEDVLDIATELVKEGKFLSNAEAIYAEEQELRYIAQSIAYIYWHNGVNSYIPGHFLDYRGGFPDLKEKIMHSLKEADDNLIDLGASLRGIIDDYNNGSLSLPGYTIGQFYSDYGNIFDRIALYDSEAIEHELNDDLEIYNEAFITHDFIDALITRSGRAGSGYRLYKYFKENYTSATEAVKFIANEYGSSGAGVPGGNGYSTWFEPSKGLKIEKGMTGHRELEIKIKYSEVAKILKYLVDNEMFFSNESDRTKYDEWRTELISKGVTYDTVFSERDEGTLRYNEEQAKKAASEVDNEDTDVNEPEADVSDIIEESEEVLEEWNYISGDEPVKIVKVSDDRYINYYGSSSAGVFDTFSQAEEMLYRHRPNAKSVIAQNYKYDMDNLVKRESFAPRSRFRDNIEAISLLMKLEAENRHATTEEQITLAKYVGWGGLQEAFDPGNAKWSNEYKELRELLNDEEYAAARESVLTSFYTSPEVIKAMYKALGNMNFKEGRILEPSCGVGNFFGCLPDGLDNTVSLHGVELDSVSGRIAKKLYPNADIQISPYERSATKDNYYDVALGNVPFGDFKVYDPKEKKWNFAIHNYFFANTIKKLKDGGVIAFVTSSYTMDSKKSDFRQYLAERCEFLGAIRLPNTAFKGVAGTDVVSDIIFLKKRAVPTVDVEKEPFIHVGSHMGHALNEYFINNPQMVLGELKEVSGRFGNVLTCADNGESLASLLDAAVNNLKSYEILPVTEETHDIEELSDEIYASPDIDNLSYGIINEKIYYRQNDKMKAVTDLSDKNYKRLEGLIMIKDCLNELISLQLLIPNDEINEQIDNTREQLNSLYDGFVKKYGYINDKVNAKLIELDVNRYKMLSLERAIEDSKDYIKSDIFVKRTVSPVIEITSCDNAVEGLAVSLSQRGRVDIDYICGLCDITEEECLEELDNLIFYDPEISSYVTADEYLSGDIAERIAKAQLYAESDTEHSYDKNIEALKKVMPEKIKAEDISVRLGSNWIPMEMYNQFIRDLLSIPSHRNISVGYVKHDAEYFITNKNLDSSRTQVRVTYGTDRKSAYEIIEDSLNLRDTKVYDYYEEDGKKKSVLNLEKTIDAQAKQDIIKEKFVEWLWADPKRVEEIETIYNERFNTIRNREFDGSFLTLPGSNPSIKLKEHQLNAVARIVYGGNTLLAHVVGAGKTFEMIAGAMESKRLGLCKKPLFVVPKHLTVQWATEFMTLYPTANILVAKETDFTPENRKKFCTRIAMGDYDAVIIGHSQFEKIPMSEAAQREFIEGQLEDIQNEIENIYDNSVGYLNSNEHLTVKKLESSKKKLEAKLNQLIDMEKKDDAITFEELGVDRLYVDEAHYYKNLFTRTKMRNIAGIPTSESQKSMDMYMKCQYINRTTKEKGVVFATGTPISNSMVEMYTLQRYLAPRELTKRGLTEFDAWASTFGNTTTAMELAPEGTGYRMKTRFSKFYNLPELVTMFKQFADVKTADMLQLDVPNAEYHNVTIESSEFQKEKLLELADRAEDVRKGIVQPNEDNMLKITTDGRKLALDQRIISPFMDESEVSKAKSVVENAMKLYRQYNDDKAVQVIFCDISTPTVGSKKRSDADGVIQDEFNNIYEDMKAKLIAEGVPESEIAFIHDANTDKRKDELFAKCRSGDVRFLFGSTFKLGAGTNIQNRLIGLHHVDVPWRPSDIEQQEGRIIRQGNKFDDVHIFRYVTEGTFDAYSWQIIENKQKFISQIMTSKTPVRVADDIDETALSYAEVKALASGNPLIKERMDIEQRLSKLEMMQTSYNSNKLMLRKKIDFEYPNLIKQTNKYLEDLRSDNERIKGLFVETEEKKEFPGITINNKYYDDIEKAGEMLIKACVANKMSGVEVNIGEYRGFKLVCVFDAIRTCINDEMPYELKLVGSAKHSLDLGRSVTGNFLRLDNALKRIPSKIDNHEKNLEIAHQDLANAKIELEKPFAHLDELMQKKARLRELDEILDLGSPKDEKQEDVREDFDDVKKSKVDDKNQLKNGTKL